MDIIDVLKGTAEGMLVWNLGGPPRIQNRCEDPIMGQIDLPIASAEVSAKIGSLLEANLGVRLEVKDGVIVGCSVLEDA